jgi:hypothetical protein
MRYLFTLYFCFSNLNLFAQRSYERDKSPLASGDTVLKSVGYAFCIFIVAYLIVKFSNNLKENGKETKLSTNVGCFGIILGFIGFICLYPLLHWVEFIGLSIFSIGILCIIVVVVILGIYSIIKSFF